MSLCSVCHNGHNRWVWKASRKKKIYIYIKSPVPSWEANYSRAAILPLKKNSLKYVAEAQPHGNHTISSKDETDYSIYLYNCSTETYCIHNRDPYFSLKNDTYSALYTMANTVSWFFYRSLQKVNTLIRYS